MHCLSCGEKKNFVKHQKVSKYYENDCRFCFRENLNKEKKPFLKVISSEKLFCIASWWQKF